MTVSVEWRVPYPGLRSFRREESDLFFGREDCINTMVDRLAATHFLSVLGSSGTGKSSLVKTGLLDALDLGVMVQAGSSWRVVDFRPGGAPLGNLARRLLQTELDPAGSAASETDADLLRAFLLRGPRSVVEWCGDGHLPEGTNLLLLVDQFEELFRYEGYAGREEAEAFATLLIESTRSRRFPIYVVLTMRSEYLGACALIEGLAETISGGIFLTPRMTRDDCRTAIVGPATVCGVEIEDALVNRLLNDLAAFAPWDDRGSRDQLDRLVRRADQLPLLQYCLNRMCVRAHSAPCSGSITLTLADYERIGGLAGALNTHADEILGTLGDSKIAVAESLFRALTEGSTISDAVRRPTSLRELVDISGADGISVRTVVDAFRAPGCNFLAPEFDQKDPKPLADETIIDISHESLIRQWAKLSEWLEKEARARRQWRRLWDRFEDGEPLQRTELANRSAWWRAEMPTAAWMRRHGGDLLAILKFLHDSEARQRRFAPLMLPVFALTAMLTSGFFFLGINSYIFHSSTFSWPIQISFFSVTLAVGSALGLWRYSALEPKRVVFAGVTVFVLNGLGGAALVSALLAHKVTLNDAIHWWVIFLVAPCTLLGMAIFDRAFRGLLTWTLLIALLVIPTRIGALLNVNSVITDQAQTFLFVITFLIWFVGIGYQMRWGSTSINGREWQQPKIAPLGLAVFIIAAYWVNAFWIAGCFYIVYGSVLPHWSWLVEAGAISEVTALTGAFALWRFTDLGIIRSILAGAVIFALQYATAIALIATLVSQGIPLLRAQHWWGAAFFAPCVLFAFALFVAPFRSGAVWLSFFALFSGPYALLVWLSDSALLVIPEIPLTLLILLNASVWFASIGYRLQRASQLGPFHGTGGIPWHGGSQPAVSGPSHIVEKASPKLVAE